MKVKRISLQQADEAAILDFVRSNPQCSRTDLAQELGMSAATAGRTVRRLLHAGALREVGRGASSVGRRPILLEYNPLQGFVIAIDVGGTSCRAALTDLDGEVVYSDVVPVHQAGRAPLEILCGAIERAFDRARSLPAPVKALGVGVPGIVTQPGAVVSRAPNVGWEGVALGKQLKERFRVPVVVENDVNLAALGEAWRGSAHGLTNFVVVSLGTGIGAGIVVGGELLRGRHNAAGEVGYLVPGVDYLGRAGGSEGCFEALASGPGIARRAEMLLAEDERPSALRGLDAVKTADVFADFRASGWVGTAVVDELASLIALLVIALAATVDPEVVVLGGSVGTALDEIAPDIEARIRGSVPVTPAIRTSKLEGQATLLGAISAALAMARVSAAAGAPHDHPDGLPSNIRSMVPVRDMFRSQ